MILLLKARKEYVDKRGYRFRWDGHKYIFVGTTKGTHTNPLAAIRGQLKDERKDAEVIKRKPRKEKEDSKKKPRETVARKERKDSSPKQARTKYSTTLREIIEGDHPLSKQLWAMYDKTNGSDYEIDRVEREFLKWAKEKGHDVQRGKHMNPKLAVMVKAENYPYAEIAWLKLGVPEEVLRLGVKALRMAADCGILCRYVGYDPLNNEILVFYDAPREASDWDNKSERARTIQDAWNRRTMKLDECYRAVSENEHICIRGKMDGELGDLIRIV